MRSMTFVSLRQCNGQSIMWCGEGLWTQQWLPLHLSGAWVISFMVRGTALRDLTLQQRGSADLACGRGEHGFVLL